MATLDLQVPNLIHRPGERERPERVRAWFDDLPKLNLVEFSTRIIEQLERFNHCVLEARDRHSIMTTFAGEAEHLIAQFCNQCGQVNFPLKPEKIRVYEQVQSLLEQIATGYRLLAMQLARDPRSLTPEERELLHESLLRCIEFQSRRILVAYGIYRDAPAGLWRELHHIYRFASAHDLATPRVEHLSDWSVGIAYRQICLVAISNPFNLLQNEVHELHARLRKWATAVRLLRPEEIDTHAGSTMAERCFIELDNDSPPRHGASGSGDTGSELRILDLGELARVVGDRVKQLTIPRELSYHDYLERDFLRRLRNAWNQRNIRGETRTPLTSRAVVVAGLTPVHYYLSGQQEFDPESVEVHLHGDRLRKESALSLVPLEQDSWRESETRRKLDEGVLKPRSYSFDYTAHEEDVWKKASEISGRSKSQIESSLDQRISRSVAPLDTRDASPQGLCLGCPADAHINLNVGSLLAMQEDSKTEAWRLARVRWMRTETDLSLKLGANLIPGRVLTRAVRGIEGHGAGSDYQRCLILEADDNTEYFVPAGLYHVGSLVLLNDTEQLELLRFTRLLEMTKSYNRYIAEKVAMTEARQEAVIQSLYKLLYKSEAV